MRSRPVARARGVSLTAFACVALGLCWAGPSASAQSERYPPTEEDYDDKREHRSQFWERTVEPDRSRYRERISRAVGHLEGRGAVSVQNAERRLLEAVDLIPDEPLAHWMLAVLYEDEERWQDCVAAYDQVALLDPVYEPPTTALPSGRGTEWALDYGQAICRAQLGEFEHAIVHYQRILKRGASLDARVYRGLGEAYMALGRLREAISSLELARKQNPKQWHVNYPLAVAYDRAGEDGKAAEALAIARRNDAEIKTLEAPDLLYAPVADRYYYLGLAHEAHGDLEWAIAYFRQYLGVAGESPWRYRAEQHLRALGRDPLPGPGSIEASDKVVDLDTLVQVIGQARADLHACLAATPGLLLEVRITVLGRSSRRDASTRTRRAPITPGVKADRLYSFSTTDEAAVQATQCVEQRAERIDIPRVRGDKAQYRTISFPLIAPL